MKGSSVDQTADQTSRPDELVDSAQSAAGTEDAASSADAADAARAHSTRGIFWILAGLVIVGVAAGYKWWKDLPR